MNPLLALPEDILVNIFSLLSVRDLVQCSQVCRKISAFIKNALSLQLRIELSANGMVDPGPGMTHGHVSDRLEALRRYRARLSAGMFDCDSSHLRRGEEEPMAQGTQHIVNGSIASTIAGPEPEVVVHTPPSSISGGPARRWRMPVGHLVSVGDPESEVYGAGADVSQDLLVLYHHPPTSSIGPRVHLLSLSDIGAPHPSARVPVLGAGDGALAFKSGSEPRVIWVVDIEILNQHVSFVLNIHNDYHLEVWNWKTGEKIWHRDCDSSTSHVLLDDEHLVLSTMEMYQDCGLQVYCFASDLTRTAHGPHDDTLASMEEHPDDSNPDYVDDGSDPEHLFTFSLPDTTVGSGRWRHHSLNVFAICAGFPGAHLPSPFLLDSASTIVSVHFSLNDRRQGTSSSFDLLIPLSTFRTHIDRVRASIASGRGRGLWYDRFVPYPEWGPAGTLLLTRSHPPSGDPSLTHYSSLCVPYGSRHPYLLCNSHDNTSGDVLIFDLDPRVARHALALPCIKAGVPEDDRVVEKIVAEPAPPPANEKMQMSAPFAAYPKVHVEFPESARPTHVVMNHDGFTIMYEGYDRNGRVRDAGFQTFTL